MAKKKRYKSNASEAIHEVATGFYREGLITYEKMREYDESCLTKNASVTSRFPKS